MLSGQAPWEVMPWDAAQTVQLHQELLSCVHPLPDLWHVVSQPPGDKVGALGLVGCSLAVIVPSTLRKRARQKQKSAVSSGKVPPRETRAGALGMGP